MSKLASALCNTIGVPSGVPSAQFKHLQHGLVWRQAVNEMHTVRSLIQMQKNRRFAGFCNAVRPGPYIDEALSEDDTLVDSEQEVSISLLADAQPGINGLNTQEVTSVEEERADEWSSTSDDEIKTDLSLFLDNFRMQFDYFTPIFFAGVISVMVGFFQSINASSGLEILSIEQLLEFQAPVQFAIFGAVFLQAIAGWGFALAAIAGVSSLGPDVTVQEAQALVAMIAVPVDTGMFQPFLKAQEFDRSLIDRWVVGALVGTPIGVLFLKYVDQKVALFGLGSFLLAYCVYASYEILSCYNGSAATKEMEGISAEAQGCKLPPETYPISATWFTGLVAGILGGAFDAPGPPLVVFADLTGMANASKLTKANLLAFFAVESQLVAVVDVLDGRFAVDTIWPTALLAVPTMLLGNAAGNWFAQFVDQEKFRWIIIGLLAISGFHQIGVI